MKKYGVILAFVFMTMSLAACGKNNQPEELEVVVRPTGNNQVTDQANAGTDELINPQEYNDTELLENNSVSIATAGSNYYENEEYFKNLYLGYAGNWYVIWPDNPNNINTEEYEIFEDGSYRHYTYNGNEFSYDGCGTITIIEGQSSREIDFFDEDGYNEFNAYDVEAGLMESYNGFSLKRTNG